MILLSPEITFFLSGLFTDCSLFLYFMFMASAGNRVSIILGSLNLTLFLRFNSCFAQCMKSVASRNCLRL